MSLRRLFFTAGLAAAAGISQNIAFADTAETVFGVTASNSLIRFNSEAPDLLDDSVSITGLQTSETILGIDFRPQTNELFALGSTGRVYTLNIDTGTATQVGTTALTLTGTSFGFDFNPTVDRIRFVSDQDANGRINPNTGALAAADTTLAYDVTDTNALVNPTLAASAYTNNAPNFPNTTLFGIDSGTDTLVRQGSVTGSPTSPNVGTLFTIGSLGVDASTDVGFDIGTPTSGRALASIVLQGETASKLYSIDLAAGRASLLGTIGGTSKVVDIAVHRAGAISLDQATYSVNENGATLSVVVERDGGSFGPYGALVAAGTPTPLSTPVTTNLATSNGTGTAGSDYTQTTTTLSFAEGEKFKAVSIPILDDAVVESAETFTVSLSGETGGAIIEDTGSASVAILDNDVAATATPTATATADTTAPTVLLSTDPSFGRAAFLAVGVPTDFSCSETCSGTVELIVNAATARRAGIGSVDTTIGTATASITGAGKSSITVKVTDSLKRSFRRLARFFVTVRATLKDGSNNTTTEITSVEVSTVRR